MVLGAIGLAAAKSIGRELLVLDSHAWAFLFAAAGRKPKTGERQ